MVVSLAVPILRRTRPGLYLMSNLSIETWLRFLAWLALGLLVYVGYGRRYARLAQVASGQPRSGARG